MGGISGSDGCTVHRLIIAIALLTTALPALAHYEGHVLTYWVFWAMVLAVMAYAIGWVRSSKQLPAWKPALFAVGMLLMGIAAIGPVAHWSHVSIAGHMTQHMLLLAVIPPLLLLARPLPQFLLALPLPLRRRVGPVAGHIYHAAGNTPVSAFIVHGLIIWLWHLPSPLQISITHPLLHDAVHLLFLGSGLWFWWSLMAPARLGRGGFGPAAILSALTVMHTGMLGALLTFAPGLLYPEHPAGFRGLSELSDQQLAGLIMWVPGGLIYTIAALILAAAWLRQAGRDPGTLERGAPQD
jgi:putative membrane protein